jgi:hypothetical protein
VSDSIRVSEAITALFRDKTLLAPAVNHPSRRGRVKDGVALYKQIFREAVW